MRGALRGFVLAAATVALVAQQQPGPELAIAPARITVDGDLADWAGRSASRIDTPAQVVAGAAHWSGPADCATSFLASFDSAHLYLAGQVDDDRHVAGEPVADGCDRLELHFGFAADGAAATATPDDATLFVLPLDERAPWSWADSQRASRQPTSQLAGIRVASRRTSPTSYTFELAVPFHHFPALRPGAPTLGLTVVVRDVDPPDLASASVLSWNGRDPAAGKGLGLLRFAAPGPMVGGDERAPLLSSDLLADVPYLLVPLGCVLGLVLLLRRWPAVRHRRPWLRPLLIGGGVAFFVVGALLPSVMARWRADAQHQRLDGATDRLASTLSKLEAGTLASYRGASRDRALMQLLAGESIARQRATDYRPLARIAPDQFGPPLRRFDELPVRPYWLPLLAEQPETFQFDPPLRGSRIHVVLARPLAPAFTFAPRPRVVPRLDLQLDFGGATPRTLEIDLERGFADGSSLGRDHWEACVVPVELDRDLRALTASLARGTDFRLVGISLEGAQRGRIEPVMLGTPTRSGVLTDLRGPYPLDAGIELAPGATAKVVIPRDEKPPQRLWFFYRAIYPGVPTAVPGAKVAEIVLHFGEGQPKRTIVLEHQVSVFYELAFRNTRDDPPPDSLASIALAWIDESKERHVNLGYPVTDLPANAPLEAIEFKNVAEYRLNFRSVVLVDERAAAPQDPPDSPLVRTANGMALPPAYVDDVLRGAAVTLYRDGRLSESTLPAEARDAATVLPRAAAAEPLRTEAIAADGSRLVTRFVPLRGDGWDGAVLAIAARDRDWAAAARTSSRWGLLLCLASAPFLLVLLSELLAASTTLRVRLVTVTSLVSLAPLGLLSLVLVQVLESGHRGDVEAAMRTTVRSAMAQLDSQKQKVQASAQQWLAALTRLAATKLAGLGEAQFAAATAAVRTELQQLLVGQLPPEWHGGFLRLDWQPLLGRTDAAPVVLTVGDERMAGVETPTRLEPNLFMQWGELLIGVRAEQRETGGTYVLTAARPVDGTLLGALAPNHDVLLTDVRGYPLAASAGRVEAGEHLRQSLAATTMAQRERAVNLGLEQRQPIVERLASARGNHVFGSEVLLDLQDTPRALLLVAQPDQRATLDLAVGRIPVRAFFLLVAGSLVVLSVFLSFVVSNRISRPIERLERGAQALSRGQLDTRVQVEDGGQIGSLTRAFNQMAADLQARLQDLQALNRTMSELASEHDEATTVEVLRRFCKTQTSADAVAIALADGVGQRLTVHGGGAAVVLPLTALPFAAFAGPFVCAARSGELGPPWSQLAGPGKRSLLALPIVFGGQARGVVALGYEGQQPWPVDLDLLSTVVAQAAVAFERCQLQRMAVQDPVTATFTPEYFRRRVVDEVSLAQQRGRTLVMLAIALGEGDRRPRGLRRLAAVLREHLPRHAVLCHAGGGQFLAAVPAYVRAQAEACLTRIAAAWDELVAQLPENEVEEQRPAGVVVQFPDEAASAEFLFEALQARLVALHSPGGTAMESDESLQRAGVTAVSPAMRAVYGTLRRVAPTDLPILLEGETGVGKEVLTNLVHRWSRRAGGPLVKVHCAALPETLLASELFGHEKGAFTGADRRKIGRFEQADGGTLFLDEVGEIPLDVQVKLLRVLQEREVDRVGGSEPVKVDVRVIAATNRDIARMVADGTFREDLYYRLQGVVVKVPPLRERKQELGSLVEQFRAEIVAGGHAAARRWSTDALDELFRHDWPGNIRELRNTVFRAMVLARGDVVQLRDVQAVLAVAGGGAPAAATPPAAAPSSPVEAGPPSEPVPPVLIPPPPATDRAAARERETPTAWAATADALPARGAEGADAVAAPEAPDDEALEEVGVPAPGGAPFALAPRLEDLRQRVVAAGRYTTQDHMTACGISHRTALRDLQALVATGHLERVGSRRGTFYRPTRR
jgi:DNA-binding NtrC family response regulator/HAMP domain-containing protein